MDRKYYYVCPKCSATGEIKDLDNTSYMICHNCHILLKSNNYLYIHADILNSEEESKLVDTLNLRATKPKQVLLEGDDTLNDFI